MEFARKISELKSDEERLKKELEGKRKEVELIVVTINNDLDATRAKLGCFEKREALLQEALETNQAALALNAEESNKALKAIQDAERQVAVHKSRLEKLQFEANELKEDIGSKLSLLDYNREEITEVEQSLGKLEKRKQEIDASLPKQSAPAPKPSVSPVKVDVTPDCSICLERKINCCLQCGHTFCRTCIDQLLRTNATCPNCRKAITGVRNLYL
jgi:uncharacterized protein YoxC